MNHILKAITDHPEAFDLELKDNLSQHELLQIIYSAKKLGTSVQQNSMNITKLYFGWTVLVKLGLRSIAIPMGVELLQAYNWNNHYHFAADICSHIMRHYYGFENIDEAEKYENMFRQYRDVFNLEAEMETLYCKVIYKSEHGLDINKSSIEKDIQELESRLQFDSCKYHYYYFHCKCILSEGEEYEKWCLQALAYFKNLYFKHEIYQNIFVKQLYTYYLEIEEYQKVLDEITDFIHENSESSKSWYRLKYIQIIALWNTTAYDEASKEITYCQSLKKYNNLSKAHQEEWNYLAQVIHSKAPKKITVDKFNPS